MRHAKSSWSNPSLADHDRPLNSRGKTDAPKMGDYLSSLGLVPEIILCSTAKRARQTVQYLINECPFEGKINYFRNLYHGGLEDYIEVLNEIDNMHNIVMIVGHNPGMEYAVEELSGENEVMPTASIAHIELDLDTWSSLSFDTHGELLSIIRPKEIT